MASEGTTMERDSKVRPHAQLLSIWSQKNCATDWHAKGARDGLIERVYSHRRACIQG
jgi:hypothetical protein